jgi:hypothetical protein
MKVVCMNTFTLYPILQHQHRLNRCSKHFREAQQKCATPENEFRKQMRTHFIFLSFRIFEVRLDAYNTPITITSAGAMRYTMIQLLQTAFR